MVIMSAPTKFYKSKEWLAFRQMVILDRSYDDGIICEMCSKAIVDSKRIHIHHIKELDAINYLDTTVSLNPDNVQLICHSCHNKIHGRWQGGYKKKSRAVYIVYGAPMSGKTSYVLKHKEDNDLVIDIDRLYEAISLKERYDKPDALKLNVLSIRNFILDNIKTRYGGFNNAWIIGGYADKYQREKLARELGAELVYIKSTKEDCIYKLNYCNDYRQYHQEEWKEYIEKWFDRFVE